MSEHGKQHRSARPVLPKLLAAVAFGFAGFLAVTSSLAAEGTDLRAERQADLRDLVRAQVQHKQELEQEAKRLRDQVDALSRRVNGVNASAEQNQAKTYGKYVGLDTVRGPGVTVTLDDAPPEMRTKVKEDWDALVIHQQDIQAVANALWAGGARAMTIQGQRVVSNSSIRCVGNSVVLDGVPYPPPYRISAIGDVSKLVGALDTAPGIPEFLEDAAKYQLGYDVERSEKLKMDGFTGSLRLRYAQRG